VEKIRHKLVLAGFDNEVFLRPVEGRDGIKIIRLMAEKIWELTFKISERRHETA
jgi:hypothetical protein